MLIMNGVVGFFGWIILTIILLLPVIFPVIDEEEDKSPKDRMPKSVYSIPAGIEATSVTFEPPPSKVEKEEVKQSLYIVYVWDLSMLAAYPWYLFMVWLCPIPFGIAYTCVMTYGAVKMQSLESRTWGIVASSMCIFPFATTGFAIVVGMVITLIVYMVSEDHTLVGVCLLAFLSLELLGCIGCGVWGLMTLMRPEVIDGFEYVPDV
jgi:hypothetical protein